MYFWDVQSLKNDIRANKLSEKDKFLYMFLSIAFVTIGIELISISPLEPQNVWDAVESVSYILIVLFGTYWRIRPMVPNMVRISLGDTLVSALLCQCGFARY